MSDIRQVMKITQDGDCVIFPSDTWTDHAAEAVSEVTVHKTEHYDKDGDLRSISTRTSVKMHPKQAVLALLSQQLSIIGKAAKHRPLRLEELGVVILPRLDAASRTGILWSPLVYHRWRPPERGEPRSTRPLSVFEVTPAQEVEWRMDPVSGIEMIYRASPLTSIAGERPLP